MASLRFHVKLSLHNGYDPGYRYGLSPYLDLNSNCVHRANLFNYINLTQPDNSGMLRFLTDELQDAEDNGDRGVSLCKARNLVVRLLTFSISLDYGPRSHRLGWVQSIGVIK